MALQSALPANLTPAIRLKEYLPLVREMSRQRSPHDLARVFRARARFVVPHDHNLTLTRLNAGPGELRLLASTLADLEFDPWTHAEGPLRLRTAFGCQLMCGARPVKIDQLELPPGDPLTPYMRGMNALLAAPIFQNGEAQHLIVLLRKQPAAFTLDELSTLLLTVNLVGHASAQSELAQQLRQAYADLDREFRQIGEIQRELLPQQLPHIPGVALAAYYETSTRAGGDYYDFFELRDGGWGIFLADVSGHGAPAAVVMARIHALLHAPMSACPNVATTPIEVLAGLNHCLVQSTRAGHFVTALYGVLDPAERSFRYVNAGHNLPRWLHHADGRVTSLRPTDGLPLAIVDPLLLTDHVVRFEPGDRLLLYTDGVTETFGAAGEMFGVERLDAALRRAHGTPQATIDAVLADLRDFSGGAPPADDRTLVAVAFE